MKEIFLKVEESKFKFFLELIKNLDFVKIETIDGDSDEEIKANIIQGLKELGEFQKGKLKTTTTKAFIDEL